MHTIAGNVSASGLRVGIIVSRWNEFITDRLLQGALAELRRHGADDTGITVVYVPGSFEIPLAAKAMAESGSYDALVALGCVIRGATSHYEYVSSAVTTGINSVTLQCGIPIGFGVLTTENLEQAIERAGSKAGNKGAEAAMTAVEMARLVHTISGGKVD